MGIKYKAQYIRLPIYKSTALWLISISLTYPLQSHLRRKPLDCALEDENLVESCSITGRAVPGHDALLGVAKQI